MMGYETFVGDVSVLQVDKKMRFLAATFKKENSNVDGSRVVAEERSSSAKDGSGGCIVIGCY